MEEKKFNTEWLATFLFCFFLGIFGAHRFYTGKTGSAVAMLLITILLGWIGIGVAITGIWALVDLILIACAKFTG
ncbi:TM2 domain-containing protein, partial [bacterium]|nr:TM2 domain-containing protein [bacterium]